MVGDIPQDLSAICSTIGHNIFLEHFKGKDWGTILQWEKKDLESPPTEKCSKSWSLAYRVLGGGPSILHAA